MNRLPFFDIESIRTLLEASDVPTEVRTAYLQLLTNLNALSVLTGPSPDLQEEEGDEELNRLFQNHIQGKQALEDQYPVLAVASRPSVPDRLRKMVSRTQKKRRRAVHIGCEKVPNCPHPC